MKYGLQVDSHFIKVGENGLTNDDVSKTNKKLKIWLHLVTPTVEVRGQEGNFKYFFLAILLTFNNHEIELCLFIGLKY